MFGRVSDQARALSLAEMLLCVTLMAGGAGLVGAGWALDHVYAVGAGVLAIIFTPMRMLAIQAGPGPFDRAMMDVDD